MQIPLEGTSSSTEDPGGEGGRGSRICRGLPRKRSSVCAAVLGRALKAQGRAWEQGMQGGMWRKSREMQGEEAGRGIQRELTALCLYWGALCGGE